MSNENIKDYIAKQRQEGVSDEAIKKAMIVSGWPEDQVSKAFSGHNSDDLVGKLLSPGELLSTSFAILKSRFWALIGIQLLPTLIIFLIGLFGVLGGVGWQALNITWNTASIVTVVVVGFIVIIGAIYVSLWSQVALFQAIINADEKIGIKEAFKRSKSKIGAFFWVSFLESLVVMGGFLLLIVPGIIFSVWFMFANIIFVDQGVKGMAALAKSREYARGMWWSIVGRMAVLLLVLIGFIILIGIVAGILSSVVDSEIVKNIISQIASIVMAPLFTIYAVLLYRNIKSIKGDIPTESKGTGWINALAIWGLVGFILIPIGATAALIAINPAEKLKEARETQETSNMLAIQRALGQYYELHGVYPKTLDELVPQYLDEVPVSPHGVSYVYQPTATDYALCNAWNFAEPNCVSSTTMPKGVIESIDQYNSLVEPPPSFPPIYE